MRINVCSVRCPASLSSINCGKYWDTLEFLTEPHRDALRSSGDTCSPNYSAEIWARGDEEWIDR